MPGHFKENERKDNDYWRNSLVFFLSFPKELIYLRILNEKNSPILNYYPGSSFSLL